MHTVSILTTSEARKVVFLTAPLVSLVVANLQSLRPVDLRQQGRETPLSMMHV